MNQLVERWSPTVLALAGGLAAFRWAGTRLLGSENGLMFIGGLGAIAIGFTATGLTILIAIEDRPIISWLRRAQGDQYNRLLRYMRGVLYWWFPALLLTGMAFVVDLQGLESVLPQVLAAGLVGLSLGGMAAWYRVSLLTVLLLQSSAALSERRLHPEDPPAARREPATREVA